MLSDKHRTRAKRLARSMTFAFVRGAASAAGAAVIALLVWWIQSH